jgi:hypothetical protein
MYSVQYHAQVRVEQNRVSYQMRDLNKLKKKQKQKQKQKL